MPVLSVRGLPQKDEKLIQQALVNACRAIAKVYDCDESQVWATWTDVKPGLYVEGSETAESQPENAHPPIGDLLCFEGSTPEEIEAVLLAASKALSDTLGLGDNIFIHYREAKSGQVVAGNGIIRK